MKAPVKILVVNDEEALAPGAAFAAETPRYQVPAVLATGEETVAAARRFHPDLVLLPPRRGDRWH